MKKTQIRLADIQGTTRLLTDAVVGITNVVEAMHHTILRRPLPWKKPGSEPHASAGGRTVYFGLQHGRHAGTQRLSLCGTKQLHLAAMDFSAQYRRIGWGLIYRAHWLRVPPFASRYE